MIGENEDGHPHFYKFPQTTIDRLEPVGDLRHVIVVGIKEQKVQVIPSQYSVHHTTTTLAMVSFNELITEAFNNPVKAKPKYSS